MKNFNKNKFLLVLFLLCLPFSITGCSKFYVNTSKSNVTNVEPGSDEYIKRMLNTVHENKEWKLKDGMIIDRMMNETLDNEKYWYYIYDNKDILRIAEDYTFVLYKDCKWWNLSYDMPLITDYESATKYTVECDNTWYFVSYDVAQPGVPFEDGEEVVDLSMFDDYKLDWLVGQEVTIENFVRTRYLHYYYLRFADERIKAGEELYTYEDIQEIYARNAVSLYEQEVLDDYESFLFYAYYENGAHFDEWLRGVVEGYDQYLELLQAVAAGEVVQVELPSEVQFRKQVLGQAPVEEDTDIDDESVAEEQGGETSVQYDDSQESNDNDTADDIDDADNIDDTDEQPLSTTGNVLDLSDVDVQSVVRDYLGRVKVVDELLVFDAGDGDVSSFRTELDDLLGISKLHHSLDFNALSLYNNYDTNENIIYGTGEDVELPQEQQQQVQGEEAQDEESPDEQQSEQVEGSQPDEDEGEFSEDGNQDEFGNLIPNESTPEEGGGVQGEQ